MIIDGVRGLISVAFIGSTYLLLTCVHNILRFAHIKRHHPHIYMATYFAVVTLNLPQLQPVIAREINLFVALKLPFKSQISDY